MPRPSNLRSGSSPQSTLNELVVGEFRPANLPARPGGAHVIQTPHWGLKSCATNSPTINAPSSADAAQQAAGRSSGKQPSCVRSGAPWRDLPERFGPYTTCNNRFLRWRRAVSGAVS
ncbi:transposase [Bradyrhizobium sp. CCBAU 11361]|uniref:transposase n=1 Tax=Bradyrhizobium sp. CCBAU 11361 TaxID=1630812 RepID=UPI003FA46346